MAYCKASKLRTISNDWGKSTVLMIKGKNQREKEIYEIHISVSKNKTVLKHSSSWFTYCLWLLLCCESSWLAMIESMGPQNSTHLLVGPFPEVFSLALGARWHQHSNYSTDIISLSPTIFTCKPPFPSCEGNRAETAYTYFLSSQPERKEEFLLLTESMSPDWVPLTWLSICVPVLSPGNELWLPRLESLALGWGRGGLLPWAPRWGGGGMLRQHI